MTKPRIRSISQNPKFLDQEASLVISSYNFTLKMKKLSSEVTKIVSSGRGKTHPQTIEILNIKRNRQKFVLDLILFTRNN